MLNHKRNAAICWIATQQGRIAGYAVLVIALMVTIDIVLRYFFNAPTKFTSQFAGYLLLVSVFFGLAYTLKERGHIRIEIVTSRLPTRVKNWFQVISSIIFLSYTIFLFYITLGITVKSFILKSSSVHGVAVPIWPIQLCIPLGLAVISLLLMSNIYTETKAALGKPRETSRK